MNADPADVAGDAQRVDPAALLGCDLDFALHAGAREREAQRRARLLANRFLDVAPALRRGPSIASTRSPRLHARRGRGRPALDAADHRGGPLDADPQTRRRTRRPATQIHRRAGEHDGELLPERGRRERVPRNPRAAAGEFSSPGFSPSIFTKPPSGNHAITYSVPLRVPARAGSGRSRSRAEAERELEHAHAASARDEEVPELVHEHQHAEHQHERRTRR